ncbi:unnamed protein product [Tilletia controversa]|uniref:Scamp-domain-containing protein n=2 Tax=Tilletia TaxID=13289 RepID=A0A9N8MHA8_9BASI|nr:hypothetical protein CF328_g2228 [Tilletia controversa]CAD6884191.1 unnamed protein product [Tilletia caries]CAD6958677.1 unnamed protein product [Tilletia laevis]CAD6916311.1 unnamed protein product [Tilletia controversa]CAD6918637.1 unnamed protein product [Tilletia controversa]
MADPYGERHTLDANPFADPAIQGALHSSARAYEPAGGPSSPYGRNHDDDDDDDGDAVSKATGNSAQAVNKMEELARRERELEQRERDLNARASHIQRHGRNNWPPFYPMLYHDIDAEIPPDSRPLVAMVYKLWLLLALSLIINLVATVFLLVGGASDGGKDMISGIVYLPVIGAASFMLWYRPLYNAYMKESSVFYYMYFVGGFHLAYSAYMVLGIPATGSAGLINTIQSFQGGRLVSAILGTIATVGFAVQGLGNLWYYRITWNHNHEQGHTFAQAKQEFATHGARAYFTRS